MKHEWQDGITTFVTEKAGDFTKTTATGPGGSKAFCFERDLEAEILRLAERIEVLEARNFIVVKERDDVLAGTDAGKAVEARLTIYEARIAGLEEENRILRIALGRERHDWIDTFKGPDETRGEAILRHFRAFRKTMG